MLSTQQTRSAVAACLAVAVVSVTGCGALSTPTEPKPRSVAGGPATAVAKSPIEQEQLKRFMPDSPQRAVLEFIRDLQVRNWFNAYNRRVDPSFRAQYDFRRFSQIASTLYERTFLPFRFQGTDRSDRRRGVTVAVRNPSDNTLQFDTYEMVRRDGRWFLVFSTAFASADIALRARDATAARVKK